MKKRFEICCCAVFVLVLLRVAIGWHFFYEGKWKYKNPDRAREAATAYLSQSRGPLAERYRALVPDFYGEERLSPAAMIARWQIYVKRAESHFGFDEQQRVTADGYLKLREAALNNLVQPTDPDTKKPQLDREIAYYLAELKKWREEEKDPAAAEIPFESKRHWERLLELKSKIKPWLDEIDALDASLKKSVQNIATAEQRAKAGPLADDEPFLSTLETGTTWTLLIAGFCLIVGLLSRPAALAGAVWMLTAVVLPQLAMPSTFPLPPPTAGHNLLVTKEMIEMLALVLLAAVPSGRWGGLDFFLYHGWQWIARKRNGRNPAGAKAGA
ncbi:MAG: hypothetical protein HYS13_22195 [Planctomycetia bacterium]|nr:hypothetical protein [Planctomycetia bacterium]